MPFPILVEAYTPAQLEPGSNPGGQPITPQVNAMVSIDYNAERLLVAELLQNVEPDGIATVIKLLRALSDSNQGLKIANTILRPFMQQLEDTSGADLFKDERWKLGGF